MSEKPMTTRGANPPPKTKRLDFRWWNQSDLNLARGLWGNPEVTRLIGGPFDDEWISNRLAREIANAKSHSIQYWPIFLIENGDHAGCCGLKPYDAMKLPEQVRRTLLDRAKSREQEPTEAPGPIATAPWSTLRVLELGFHLRTPHWRCGYASEAAGAVIHHAFNLLASPPAALFAGHHPQNDASRNVLQKLGFVYTHDEHFSSTALMHRGYVLHRE